MVDTAYCELLARYGRWMNERLYALADGMPDVERKRDSGAFFGSIHGTLSHILWADRVWLARFEQRPYGVRGYGANLFEGFEVLARERAATDAAIAAWAAQVPAAWLAATLEYRRQSDGRTVRLPGWVAATHYFQHATHHRGQVTTLMRQAGIDPGVTDLPAMPGASEIL